MCMYVSVSWHCIIILIILILIFIIIIILSSSSSSSRSRISDLIFCCWCFFILKRDTSWSSLLFFHISFGKCLSSMH